MDTLFGDSFNTEYSASMNAFDINMILVKDNKTTLYNLGQIQADKKAPCSANYRRCEERDGPFICNFYDEMLNEIKTAKSDSHAKVFIAQFPNGSAEVAITSYNLIEEEGSSSRISGNCDESYQL